MNIFNKSEKKSRKKILERIKERQRLLGTRKIILTEQPDGRWFGRVKISIGYEEINLLDEHGNDIECCLNTPEDCIKNLKKQLKNI